MLSFRRSLYSTVTERPTTAPDGGGGENHLMDWRHHAACLDEDPELFFPIGNTGPALLQIDEAKAVCRRLSLIHI